MINQDYSVRQLIEMEACTNCQICADVCPAVTVAQDGELSGVYRIKGLKEIVKGDRLDGNCFSARKTTGIETVEPGTPMLT